METLGEKIRRHRTERGLSQEQLARTLGVGLLSVGRWERDQQNPAAEHRLALAQQFDVEASEFGFDPGVDALPPAWASSAFDQLHAAIRETNERLDDLQAQLRRLVDR